MHCLQGNPSSPPIRPLPTFQTFRLSSSKYNLLMFWCCTHTCHSLESLVPGPTHFAWYISISNPYSGFSSSLAFFPCQNNQYWVTLLTYLRYTVYCITSAQIQYSKIQHHNYHWIYFSFSCVHAVVYTFWWTYVYICEGWGWGQESPSIVLSSYSLRKDHSIKPRAHRYSRILTVNP